MSMYRLIYELDMLSTFGAANSPVPILTSKLETAQSTQNYKHQNFTPLFVLEVWLPDVRRVTFSFTQKCEHSIFNATLIFEGRG